MCVLNTTFQVLRVHELRATESRQVISTSISDENSIETTRTQLVGTLPGFLVWCQVSGVQSGEIQPPHLNVVMRGDSVLWEIAVTEESTVSEGRHTLAYVGLYIISQTGGSMSIHSYWVLNPFILRCWPELGVMNLTALFSTLVGWDM